MAPWNDVNPNVHFLIHFCFLSDYYSGGTASYQSGFKLLHCQSVQVMLAK